MGRDSLSEQFPSSLWLRASENKMVSSYFIGLDRFLYSVFCPSGFSLLVIQSYLGILLWEFLNLPSVYI